MDQMSDDSLMNDEVPLLELHKAFQKRKFSCKKRNDNEGVGSEKSCLVTGDDFGESWEALEVEQKKQAPKRKTFRKHDILDPVLECSEAPHLIKHIPPHWYTFLLNNENNNNGLSELSGSVRRECKSPCFVKLHLQGRGDCLLLVYCAFPGLLATLKLRDVIQKWLAQIGIRYNASLLLTHGEEFEAAITDANWTMGASSYSLPNENCLVLVRKKHEQPVPGMQRALRYGMVVLVLVDGTPCSSTLEFLNRKAACAADQRPLVLQGMHWNPKIAEVIKSAATHVREVAAREAALAAATEATRKSALAAEAAVVAAEEAPRKAALDAERVAKAVDREASLQAAKEAVAGVRGSRDHVPEKEKKKTKLAASSNDSLSMGDKQTNNHRVKGKVSEKVNGAIPEKKRKRQAQSSEQTRTPLTLQQGNNETVNSNNHRGKLIVVTEGGHETDESVPKLKKMKVMPSVTGKGLKMRTLLGLGGGALRATPITRTSQSEKDGEVNGKLGPISPGLDAPIAKKKSSQTEKLPALIDKMGPSQTKPSLPLHRASSGGGDMRRHSLHPIVQADNLLPNRLPYEKPAATLQEVGSSPNLDQPIPKKRPREVIQPLDSTMEPSQNISISEPEERPPMFRVAKQEEKTNSRQTSSPTRGGELMEEGSDEDDSTGRTPPLSPELFSYQHKVLTASMSHLSCSKSYPKAIFHTWLCTQNNYNLNGIQNNYITWFPGGKRMYTSWFVDPCTAECFPSGPYSGSDACNRGNNGVYWFRSKKSAEHGAAAVAYDSLAYRAALQHGTLSSYKQIGTNPPFQSYDVRLPPPSTSHEVLKLFRKAVRRATHSRVVPSQLPPPLGNHASSTERFSEQETSGTLPPQQPSQGQNNIQEPIVSKSMASQLAQAHEETVKVLLPHQPSQGQKNIQEPLGSQIMASQLAQACDTAVKVLPPPQPSQGQKNIQESSVSEGMTNQLPQAGDKNVKVEKEQPSFAKNEKIFARDAQGGSNMYFLATVLDHRFNDGVWQFKVNQIGGNSRWDQWLTEDSLLKGTEKNQKFLQDTDLLELPLSSELSLSLQPTQEANSKLAQNPNTLSFSAAKEPQTKAPYARGEKVFASKPEGGSSMYCVATILNHRFRDGIWEFELQHLGWNSRWSKWLAEECLLKCNTKNEKFLQDSGLLKPQGQTHYSTGKSPQEAVSTLLQKHALLTDDFAEHASHFKGGDGLGSKTSRLEEKMSPFLQGEKVFARDAQGGSNMYFKATVLDIRLSDGVWQLKVNRPGSSSRWDQWLSEDSILKGTDENCRFLQDSGLLEPSYESGQRVSPDLGPLLPAPSQVSHSIVQSHTQPSRFEMPSCIMPHAFQQSRNHIVPSSMTHTATQKSWSEVPPPPPPPGYSLTHAATQQKWLEVPPPPPPLGYSSQHLTPQYAVQKVPFSIPPPPPPSSSYGNALMEQPLILNKKDHQVEPNTSSFQPSRPADVSPFGSSNHHNCQLTCSKQQQPKSILLKGNRIGGHKKKISFRGSELVRRFDFTLPPNQSHLLPEDESAKVMNKPRPKVDPKVEMLEKKQNIYRALELGSFLDVLKLFESGAASDLTSEDLSTMRQSVMNRRRERDFAMKDVIFKVFMLAFEVSRQARAVKRWISLHIVMEKIEAEFAAEDVSHELQVEMILNRCHNKVTSHAQKQILFLETFQKSELIIPNPQLAHSRVNHNAQVDSRRVLELSLKRRVLPSMPWETIGSAKISTQALYVESIKTKRDYTHGRNACSHLEELVSDNPTLTSGRVSFMIYRVEDADYQENKRRDWVEKLESIIEWISRFNQDMTEAERRQCRFSVEVAINHSTLLQTAVMLREESTIIKLKQLGAIVGPAVIIQLGEEKENDQYRQRINQLLRD